MSKPRLTPAAPRRAVHQSTGGTLPPIPQPVDPVDDAPPLLTPHTVAPPRENAGEEGKGALFVRDEAECVAMLENLAA
jgi:hypothetical protein